MNHSEITLDLAQGEFHMQVDGQDCSLGFRLADNTVAIDHVRVPDAVGGRGLAGQLTRHALDWARSNDYRVQPNCPYVRSWIARHPDYADLVEAD